MTVRLQRPISLMQQRKQFVSVLQPDVVERKAVAVRDQPATARGVGIIQVPVG